MAAGTQKLIAAARVIALLCAIAATAVTAAAPRVFAQRGSDAIAARVVSLVPNVTEMLFAVGAGSQVVAVSSYDDFPPAVKSLPRVGALLDPDMERIFSLRPDLVIVYGSQTELETQLGRVGIRAYPYRHGGIESTLQSIRDVARLTGHAAEGEQMVSRLRAQLDAVRTRVRGRPRPRTMLVIGRDPGTLRGVYASAGVGFLHELLELAGGSDVFGDIQREAVQPSNETILARAPDVIIEAAAGERPSDDVFRRERGVWNVLTSIPAVRNKRVYLLYGSYLVAAGPRLGEAAAAYARTLHPDAFK
jgi:iron complex transport system substrate-binding protein